MLLLKNNMHNRIIYISLPNNNFNLYCSLTKPMIYWFVYKNKCPAYSLEVNCLVKYVRKRWLLTTGLQWCQHRAVHCLTPEPDSVWIGSRHTRKNLSWLMAEQSLRETLKIKCSWQVSISVSKRQTKLLSSNVFKNRETSCIFTHMVMRFSLWVEF